MIKSLRESATWLSRGKRAKADVLERALCAISPQDRISVLTGPVNPVQRELAKHKKAVSSDPKSMETPCTAQLFQPVKQTVVVERTMPARLGFYA